MGCSESLTIYVQIPSTSAGVSPASAIASRHAATAMPRVVRPELREYAVRPIPITAQVMSILRLLWYRFARQAQDALGDEVSQDLAGATGDGQAAAEQVVVHHLTFTAKQYGRSSDAQCQFGDTLCVFGSKELGDVTFETRPGREDRPGRLPKVQRREGICLNQQRADLA